MTPLELINAARVALNLAPLSRLPRGEIGEPTACPIARSFPKDMRPSVGTYTLALDAPAEDLRRIAVAWNTYTGPNYVAMPCDLRDFVRDFDMGEIRL